MKKTFVFALFVFAAVAGFAGGSREAGILIKIHELDAYVSEGPTLILDVREPDAYTQGHIPGAVNVPLAEVEGKAADIMKLGARVVTYCSCPAEESSMHAALILRGAGTQAVRVLQGGFTAWRQSGKPVETGIRPL